MPPCDDLKEILSADAETAPGASALDAVYQLQIEAMHGVRVDAAEQGRVGRLWKIDERFGEGFYWYFPIDGLASVTVFDLQFEESVNFSCETPPLFCFGFYGRNMIPYFGLKEAPVDRKLLGYAWKGQPFTQNVKPGERLDVTSILLLPPAVQNFSLQCHCDPLLLSRAITSLDGTKEVFGLGTVFDEIKRDRPSKVTAKAYYQAKVTEALTKLLDWSLENTHSSRAPLLIADQAALSLVRAHLRDNLPRSVPGEELCRVACMSASKLTRLFKRAEGTTPQEYARRLRMERACELLEQSDLSMGEVASALGFARQGSFSEAFKDRFGVTPLEFRSLRRGSRSAPDREVL